MHPVRSRGWLAAMLIVLPAGGAAAQDFSQPGPFAVGTTTLAVPRGDRGRTVDATVYYPARKAGAERPVDRAAAPYCPIIFESVVPPDAYTSTLSHLASWGFVGVIPGRGYALYPDYDEMAAELTRCLDVLIAESSRPGSLLSGAVRSDCCGFSGHSLAGGTAILQGRRESDRLKVIVSLAPGNQTHPPISRYSGQLRTPLFIVAGANDWISSQLLHINPIYNNAPAPKGLFLLAGGNHMRFSDLAPAISRPRQLTRDEQLALSRYYLTVAFKLYLHEDDELWPLVWDPQHNALPRVDATLHSGLEWDVAEKRFTANAGETVEFEARIVNRSSTVQGCDLFADGSAWPAEIEPANIQNLPPGAGETVTVRVTIPANAPERSQTVRLSARSMRDGHTRGVARVTVAVPGANVTVPQTSPDRKGGVRTRTASPRDRMSE